MQTPEKYLQPPASTLVTLTGAPKSAAFTAKPVAPKTSSQAVEYICPMDPEIHESKPGACPICGMALEPAQISLSNIRTEYTCPMHPDIVRPEPGSCPICGMALEPRTVTVEEKNPELDDMRRRFWIATALTLPLLAIMVDGFLASHPIASLLGKTALGWVEFALATPVVLWCGWPFLVRGWNSRTHLASEHVHADRPGCRRQLSVQPGCADRFRCLGESYSCRRCKLAGWWRESLL